VSARAALPAALALAALCASCTAVAIAPEPTDDDVEVLLVDEACHKGLVLPGRDGARVEWGFGEHAWYAREQNRWHDAFRAVLWPSPGALSRREWRAEERGARAPSDVTAFRAPRARVEALGARLEAEFESALGTRIWNERSQTAFVRCERSYWMVHACHDATARWLAELGCTVEPALVRAGVWLRSRDDVERSHAARAADD
jgi:hypothetical protein